MPKNEYHDELRRVPLFAELDASQLNVVGRAATELSMPEGEVLMREGDFAAEMYVVLEGKLEVVRNGTHVAHIGPGGFAGEMALLTRCQRDATVTTTMPTRVLHIDGRSFSNLLREAPLLAVHMLPIVAARAADNARRISD